MPQARTPQWWFPGDSEPRLEDCPRWSDALVDHQVRARLLLKMCMEAETAGRRKRAVFARYATSDYGNSAKNLGANVFYAKWRALGACGLVPFSSLRHTLIPAPEPERVRAYFARWGLTDGQWAEARGCERSVLSEILAGKRRTKAAASVVSKLQREMETEKPHLEADDKRRRKIWSVWAAALHAPDALAEISAD